MNCEKFDTLPITGLFDLRRFQDLNAFQFLATFNNFEKRYFILHQEERVIKFIQYNSDNTPLMLSNFLQKRRIT